MQFLISNSTSSMPCSIAGNAPILKIFFLFDSQLSPLQMLFYAFLQKNDFQEG